MRIRVLAGRRSRVFSRTLKVMMKTESSQPAIQKAATTGPALAYRDANLPIETRVADLLQRMKLEEKVEQLRGRAFSQRKA